MEHERTSLLTPSTLSSSMRRSILTSSDLREIESRATQLVEDDDALDDESDEDILASFVETGLDDAMVDGIFSTSDDNERGKVDGIVTNAGDGTWITTKDLEIIARTASALWGGRDQDGGVGNVSPVTDRVRLSKRKLRDSVRGSVIGKFPRMPSFEAEKEGVGDDDDGGGKKGSGVIVTPPGMVLLPPQVIAKLVIVVLVLTLFVAASLLGLGAFLAGPPRQPIGKYQLLEAQVGDDFWQYYEFFAGKDSAGSNGYVTYVSREVAEDEGIINVTTEVVPRGSMIAIYDEGDERGEVDWLAEDLAFLDQLKRLKDANNASIAKVEKTINGESAKAERMKVNTKDTLHNQEGTSDSDLPRLEPFNPDTTTTTNETFVYISSNATTEGPRNSVRLEGLRRFNRGLFIIDLRHMPVSCGTWPALWLTDEANWPVNGEIDIVEGVSYQDTAKTALHATKECVMDNVPEGSKTGTWDTSVGIPNKKTGLPDMTFRYAQNCFVYDPHQWLNQGCVATDMKLEGRSLGMPLNANGGGVYALEWDPANRHIRTWVFSPHGRVPVNLRDALRTATNANIDTRVPPDTSLWGLPYGHFPIGDGTNCPASHFRNMRLVINLAFCGSVAGNRYFMDCPKQVKEFKTCNEWVASNPEELKEAYWKIRGVYVYERAWERQWS